MKNRKLYFLFIIIIFINAELNAQWDTIATGTSSILYGVQFIDENTGWIIGSSGIIRKSTDGGNNWTSQNSNTLQTLRRIKMLDVNTGFICGDSGKILKTINGGANWIAANTSTSLDLFAMDFINASTGICAGESKTQFKTTNGGTNWTGSTMSGVVSGADILGLCMIDTNILFVSTNAAGVPSIAKIYKSINSGLSYSLNYSNIFFPSTTMNDIKFINYNTGYAVASNGNWVQTTNGGSSWSISSCEKGINQVSFADSLKGFMCGEDLFKSISFDGGYNWTFDFNYNTSYDLYGICFINSSTGWMCGTNGILLKTSNASGFPVPCIPVVSSWSDIYENYISECLDLKSDSCGNIYATGYRSLNSDSDLIVMKYNSSGFIYWIRTYQSSTGDALGKAIEVNNQGDVFITGFIENSTTNKDLAVLKYNSEGIFEWIKTYDTLNNPQEGVLLTVDDSGNVIVAGIDDRQNNPLAPKNQIKIIKYNSSGNLKWNKTLGDNNDNEPVEILSNNSGDIFFTGNFVRYSFPLFFNRSVVLKLGNAGDSLWLNEFPDQNVSAMAIGNSGNIYVTGSTLDLYVTRINSSGSIQWTEYYSSSPYYYFPSAIAFDNNGRIVITGSVDSSGFSYKSEIFTIKYNSNGIFQWFEKFVHTIDGDDRSTDIECDIAGNIFITGNFHKGMDNYQIGTLMYNPSGELQKVNYFNYDSLNGSANAISLDNYGNVFVGGGIETSDQHCIVIKYSQNDFVDNELNLSSLIQGFYNYNADTLRSDSIFVFLRDATTPYTVADSSKGILDNSGNANLEFPVAADNTPYYIVIKHRNSIETWSASPQSFTSGLINYDFSNSASHAYGSNMIQVDASPVKFAIYSGDVNQDGVIDASDNGAIDNDAANFATGYLSTDLNGDEVIDASDAAIADNNAANFVSAITP